jgi:hypothetical protein
VYLGGGAAAGLAAGLIISGLHSLHPAAGSVVTLGCMIAGLVVGGGVQTGVIKKLTVADVGVEFAPPGAVRFA